MSAIRKIFCSSYPPQPPFELEHNFQTCEVPYNGGGGECFANRKRHKESFRKEKF